MMMWCQWVDSVMDGRQAQWPDLLEQLVDAVGQQAAPRVQIFGPLWKDTNGV